MTRSNVSRHRSSVATVALALAATGVLAPSPAPAAPGGALAAPVDLAVGGAVDPLGLDDTTPDLQWRSGVDVSAQTAFEVRVASSADRLDEPDLWESGRVKSSVPSVEYDGDRLGSRDRAVWQVRVWGERGGVSAWSEPTSIGRESTP